MDKLKVMKVFVEIVDMGSLMVVVNSLEILLILVVCMFVVLEDYLKVWLFNCNIW